MSQWFSILLHILVVAGGVAGSLASGNAHTAAGIMAAGGAINALLPSPIVGGQTK
jgi:hypothetical protein